MKGERAPKTTPEHRAEAAKLRELWEKRQQELTDRGLKPPSQAAFGQDYGIGVQSAVWRFMDGRDQLSLNAAKGFARGLGCLISDFSPRLAQEIIEAIPLVPADELDLTKLNRTELQLVQLFRGLGHSEQQDLMARANGLYEQSHPTTSQTAPKAADTTPRPTPRPIGAIPRSQESKRNKSQK